MFGGTTVDDTGKHRINDVFLFTCFQDTIVSCCVYYYFSTNNE